MSFKSFLNTVFSKSLVGEYDPPQSLIAVLLDRKIDWAERDDAATYLIDYNEPEVEAALFTVASDQTEDKDIAESCGEVVAEIWCRQSIFSIDKIKKLTPSALQEAVGIIHVRKPEWMPILESEGLRGAEYGEFRFDLKTVNNPQQDKLTD